jgi:hypothetical protein
MCTCLQKIKDNGQVQKSSNNISKFNLIYYKVTAEVSLTEVENVPSEEVVFEEA